MLEWYIVLVCLGLFRLPLGLFSCKNCMFQAVKKKGNYQFTSWRFQLEVLKPLELKWIKQESVWHLHQNKQLSTTSEFWDIAMAKSNSTCGHTLSHALPFTTTLSKRSASPMTALKVDLFFLASLRLLFRYTSQYPPPSEMQERSKKDVRGLNMNPESWIIQLDLESGRGAKRKQQDYSLPESPGWRRWGILQRCSWTRHNGMWRGRHKKEISVPLMVGVTYQPSFHLQAELARKRSIMTGVHRDQILLFEILFRNWSFVPHQQIPTKTWEETPP